MIVGRPTIANVDMSSANTEYSYTFPDGTRRFEIKLRSQNALLQIAFEEGESNTDYITIPYGSIYTEDDSKVGNSTIYFQSPSASQTAEIKIWK